MAAPAATALRRVLAAGGPPGLGLVLGLAHFWPFQCSM